MNIAFIPAKGTSARVPDKNLQMLGEKSLVQITLEFAESLGLFDRIYLSTDSAEIVGSATRSSQFNKTFLNSNKGEIMHARDELYIHRRRDGDSSQSAQTISPLLNCLSIGSHASGNLTILQPTSPFRLNSEYQEIFRKFHEGSATSLISVRRLEGLHPLKCFQIEIDDSLSVTEERLDFLTTPVQNLPKYYAADGAYYLTKIEHLIANKEILSKQTMTYLRQGIYSLNIDTLEELEFAKRFIETNPNVIEFLKD
jgi:CMP-N-acetylneuraminic acid synthetase